MNVKLSEDNLKNLIIVKIIFVKLFLRSFKNKIMYFEWY